MDGTVAYSGRSELVTLDQQPGERCGTSYFALTDGLGCLTELEWTCGNRLCVCPEAATSAQLLEIDTTFGNPIDRQIAQATRLTCSLKSSILELLLALCSLVTLQWRNLTLLSMNETSLGRYQQKEELELNY